ncbi:MAG: hypothetical protein RL748_2529 [Pseudomonadota bacterium]|jgi:DNA-binding transcriptional LysR family regulator
MKPENISWDDLRFFLHVGRGGSLSSAAHTMVVSHSTAFRRLQRLEAEIGVRLFERSRAGYTLTEAGQELMEVAQDLERGIHTAARRIGGRDAWPGGVVRITTSDTLMHSMLPPILAAYQAANAVQVHVSTSTALSDILRGEADVALRAGGRPPEPLVGRRVCRIESTIYHARSLTGVNMDNLAQFPWVAGDESFAHLDSSKWLARQGLDRVTAIRTNSHINLLNLLKSGAGLGVLACHMGDAEPTLRRLMPPRKDWRSDLWLLTRTELRNVPRIKALFDAILQGQVPQGDGVGG